MANGPRKELSFLDRALMNKAATQGGVLNFLGQQPQVTAPIKAQSHADSPPVQLAYITDAEKDLLVKSNIHGSLAGKPNPGPAGIPSLDDFFTTPGGGIGGGSTADSKPDTKDDQGNFNVGLGGGSSSGGGQSAEDFGINPGMAVGQGSQGAGTVYDTTQFEPAPGQADKPGKLVEVSPKKQKQLEALAETNRLKTLANMGILNNQSVSENKGFGFEDFLKNNMYVQMMMKVLGKKVTPESIKDPNFLSILKSQVLTTDAEKERFFNKYEDVMKEAGLTLEEFNKSIDEASSKGVQGEESQYRLDPASYLDEELYKQPLIEDPDNPGKMISEYDLAMRKYPKFLIDIGLRPRSSRFDDQTSGGLTKIAQSNISQYKKFLPDGSRNPKYNPEFLQKVYDARIKLEEMGTNWQTGNKNDDNFKNQTRGIPSIPGIPSLPVPRPGPIPPDSYPLPGQPPNVSPLPPGVIPPFGRPPFGRPPYYGDKFEGPRPYNYFAQSPQYMPQYRFRGVPSLNTDEFNEELRKRFGIG